MNAVVRVENLTKRYSGVDAVKGASFAINQGEVVGFVGLNGAGKSTTINMLLGFQKPSAGEVYMFGERLITSNAHKSHRSIGFAAGDMALFDNMTGRQYLRFVARSYGQTIQTKTFDSLVKRFEPQLDKSISALSRGNKQKIALIAAFMTEPKLVVLDEPSSGLDPLMQQNFLNLVREESKKGTTIFMSSHYLNEVVDVCSRILLIKNGELIKDVLTSQLEPSAGKLVQVVTKNPVKPPKLAESIERKEVDGEHILKFIYKDKALRLQEWLGSLPHLKDISITDHSVETAFEDLYQKELKDV